MREIQPSENSADRKASYETSEEVLLGLIKAFSDFQRAVEDARE
ncbi:hypothetical protein [Salinimicrobium gaetbulicola]|uniref:Uncharacterized protein n=1 Tax=Salinimicrobium gaetbulicola TaxID=999702 RepID=A0ABW3IFK4_9FLAO